MSAAQAAVLFFAASCVGALSGCTEQRRRPDAAPFAVRDSADIEIVTNILPLWADDSAGWAIAPEPYLQIGAVDRPAEQVLHGVVSVSRAQDDEIVVAQRTDISLFNSSGFLARKYGSPGRGPGEFMQIAAALSCGERVIATDLVQPRITMFWPDSVEIVPLAAPAAGRLNPLLLQLCLSDGYLGIMLGPSEFAAGGSGVSRSALLLLRMGFSGTLIDTVVSVPGREVYRGLQVPFGAEGFVSVSDSSIYVAASDSPQIQVLDLSGRIRKIIRLALPTRDVTTTDVDRIHQQYLDGAPPAARAEIEPLLLATPIPSAMPFFSALHAGADGTAWLKAYEPFRDEPAGRWIVLGKDGRWLGDVRMPASFVPHHFGSDDVLGVWTNEYDVEFVRAYAIIR